MKKRKYTLQETWTLCLKMWRWIADYYVLGDNIAGLKERWLKLHGFSRQDIDSIWGHCFFCGYDRQNYTPGSTCTNCPAALVNPDFRCFRDAYHYEKDPKKFYKRIAKLHKIWLKQEAAK